MHRESSLDSVPSWLAAKMSLAFADVANSRAVLGFGIEATAAILDTIQNNVPIAAALPAIVIFQAENIWCAHLPSLLTARPTNHAVFIGIRVSLWSYLQTICTNNHSLLKNRAIVSI